MMSHRSARYLHEIKLNRAFTPSRSGRTAVNIACDLTGDRGAGGVEWNLIPRPIRKHRINVE